MNFVERMFGVSPDGGNGLFEVIILIVPIAAVILWLRYRSQRR